MLDIYNPFANAAAFDSITTPEQFASWFGKSLAGSTGRSTVRCVELKRAFLPDGSCADAWVRHASADASTDYRTVILHTIDIATPNIDNARAIMRRVIDPIPDSDSAEWHMSHTVLPMSSPLGNNIIRFAWVEDLS